MTSAEDGRPRTHLDIDRRLCGEPIDIGPGRARLEWTAPEETAADHLGLVHGGFVFGLADYAAMLAVNEPTVVLVSAETRFRRPVRVGDRLEASAIVIDHDGSRRTVEVTVRNDKEDVLRGVMRCVVTPQHVLESAS